MKIVALDPGGTTGVALVDSGTVLRTAELKPGEVVPWLREYVSGEYVVMIVVEQFTINAMTHRRPGSAGAMEVIGRIQQFAEDEGMRITYQYPNQKPQWPNPRLKEIGFWHKGGGGHALDALRHAAIYLTGQRIILS